MELRSDVVRFIFHPSRHIESGETRRRQNFWDTAIAGTRGVQLMCHHNEAQKIKVN
jgi:hypothetical protein